MPHRFTLRQLEYFVAAGESGSIAAASQKLNVSSPSISAAISQLEAELGVSLFLRQHAQGLRLTEAGGTLATQARTVLGEATELTRLAGAVSGTVQGPLRVGCLVTFAQIVLPSLRRSFEARFPDVRMRQVELTQSDIFAGLRRGEIDLALSYDMTVPADLEFHPIRDLSPFVLLSPDHALAGRDSLTVRDLAPHPMVLLDLPMSADYFLAFFTRADLRPMISERTRDMAVMRSLVANGFGYSIANFRPRSTSAPDGKPLSFVPLTGDVAPMAMGVVGLPGAMNSRTNAAFFDHASHKLTDEAAR
jgi:DNA-binding transcriptional LysR family regulator